MKKIINMETDRIEALCKGDYRAFEELFVVYFDQVTCFFDRSLKPGKYTEILVQEVFIRLWFNRNAIDPHHDLDAYIYAAACNVLADHFRSINQAIDACNWDGSFTSREIRRDRAMYDSLESVKMTIRINESKMNPTRRFFIWVSLLILLFFLIISCFFINENVRIMEIMTRNNERKIYVLPDTTGVRIKPDSLLVYWERLMRTVFLEDETYFSIQPGLLRPFVVKTKDICIAELGTKFDAGVYCPANWNNAALRDGKIQVVMNRTHNRFVLSPDQ